MSSKELAAHIDPLKDAYHEGFIDNPAHERFLADRDTALLCIDLQYLDAAPGHGVFADATSHGMSVEAQQYYFDRLRTLVFPNVRRCKMASVAADWR